MGVERRGIVVIDFFELASFIDTPSKDPILCKRCRTIPARKF